MEAWEVENVRIANRLFLWFALLTVFVALSVFSCLYFAVRPSLQRTAYGALEGTAQSDLRAVDQAISAANAVSVNTTYSAGIREAMAKLNHRGALTHAELNEAAEQLVAINGTMFPVIQIRLYPESGLMLASGMINGQYVFSRSSLPWFPEVMAADGSKVISRPYRDESLSKRGYVIALRRAFKLSYRQTLGMVEVVLDAQSAFNALGASSTYLLDADGGVLYPFGEALDEDVIRRITSGAGAGIAEAVKGETPVLAAWRKSDVTGWTIVSVRARSEVMRPLMQMMFLTLGITAALLFAALIFAYILSRQITRPIGLLAARMRAFALGGSEAPRAVATDIDELAALDGAFENLKTDLSRSVQDLLQARERELESRMMALQSQMNPHFLHNALGNLQALIELGDAPRAARLIDGMSRMLRYIASDESPVVPLADEMRHAEDYMALMQLRFGEKLRFELDRGDLPGDMAVPKLSIQPLIENAVKYGCSGRPPWRVKLELAKYRDGWRADVTDDGAGFDQKTLEKLLEGVERVRRTGVLPSLKIDGMGLLNIAMRLNLYQGGDFLFHIQNLDGGGCVVSIGSPNARKSER
jgi:two-component system sensor histidine kinase YesM